MRTILALGAALLSAAALSSPALADPTTSGSGFGIGGSIGTSQNIAIGNTSSISLDATHTIGGASGSGFSGNIAAAAGNGLSVASLSGSGVAASHTDVATNFGSGQVNSISSNSGAFTGSAVGQNAAVSAEVMNFGQSNGKIGVEFSYDAAHSDSFTQSNWGQIGGNFGNWSFEGF